MYKSYKFFFREAKNIINKIYKTQQIHIAASICSGFLIYRELRIENAVCT